MSPFYLRHHPEARFRGDIAEIQTLASDTNENQLSGVENVFEKNLDNFETLLKGPKKPEFAQIHHELAHEDIFLDVQSGESELQNLKQNLYQQA